MSPVMCTRRERCRRLRFVLTVSGALLTQVWTDDAMIAAASTQDEATDVVFAGGV